MGQNGLLRVIENGSLLAGSVLDISARVAPPLSRKSGFTTFLDPCGGRTASAGLGALITRNANHERGLPGLAFHPGLTNPASAGYSTLYAYSSEWLPAGTLPSCVAPNHAPTG